AARPRASPEDVVGDGNYSDGDRAQQAARFHEPVTIGVGFKMIPSFKEFGACFLGQNIRHLVAKTRMGVDAGPYGGSSCRQLSDGCSGRTRLIDTTFQLPGK